MKRTVETTVTTEDQVDLDRLSARCPFCGQVNYSLEDEYNVADRDTCEHYDGHNWQSFVFYQEDDET